MFSGKGCVQFEPDKELASTDIHPSHSGRERNHSWARGGAFVWERLCSVHRAELVGR